MRKYLIIKTSELDNVDFSQTLFRDKSELQFSLDGTKTYIKWDGDDPTFLSDLRYKEGPYDNGQIISIVAAHPDWYQDSV
jgi:hypothetical protein